MKVILLLAFTVFALTGFSQNVGIGTDNPDPTAKLDISSARSGLLVPRMTSSERNQIVNPAKGLMVFDSTVNTFWFYNGNAWNQMIYANNVRFGFDLSYNSASLMSYNIPFVSNYNLDPVAVSLPNSTTLLLQREGLYRFNLLGYRHTEQAGSAIATSATLNLSITINSKQYRLIVNGAQTGSTSFFSFGSTAISFDLFVPANSTLTINAVSSLNSGFIKGDTGHFFGYLISE